MLTLNVPKRDYFNEATDEFTSHGGFELSVEHSLYAMSLWESKWKKAFLSTTQKTKEETTDYIRCMCLSPGILDEEFDFLPTGIVNSISEYITTSQTATTITTRSTARPSREVVTAEVVYYWMVSFRIPFECERWHFTRLMALIQVCSIKSEKPKNMSRSEAMARQRSLNAQRRTQTNSKG